MSYPVINAPVRTELGKGPNRRLRASGMFPAVLYGKGKEPVSLVLEPRQIADLLNGTYGKNTVISLQIEGEEKKSVSHVHLGQWLENDYKKDASYH